MRVILFTSEEPLYLPSYVEPVLAAHGDAIDRVVLAPFDAPLREQLREQAGMYGVRGGVKMAAATLRGLMLDALPGDLEYALTGRYHSVAAAAAAYDVPVERVPDVSDPAFVSRFERLDPDLVLSIVAGQRLPESVLDAADDAVNLHGSLLPKYRGRATAFWPLYYGDDRTGVTAHRMTSRFDAGPILAQSAFELAVDDTVDDVYRQLASTGADLAVSLLDDYPSLPAGSENDTDESDYHGVPGRDERRAFRRRGGRFR